MAHYLIIFFVHCFVMYVCNSQRAAPPGVPPQQYQQQQQYQPPQYQQPQYQQAQFQQVPAQHQVPVQQVPVQQVPVQQVPVQQVPVQQQVPQPQHHGHHAQHSDQVLNTANIAKEKEHIAEHFDVPIDTSKMTEQELQFHYFKMHDADNNNKLDGCELVKSLLHWHEESKAEVVRIYTDEEIDKIIGDVLNMMDTNNDGFVDYTEYIIKNKS